MWVPVSEKLPRAFSRVWVKTDNGAQATGYINEAGKWRINCSRIAAEHPTVVSWRE